MVLLVALINFVLLPTATTVRGEERSAPPAATQIPPAVDAESTLHVPPGYRIEKVAGPPLVNRPISCDFDEQGRLYVSDSSGTNDPITIQLKLRPHRVVCLEDTNGDGKFDKSTVFANHLSFPEGVMWYDGSLYVGAPPQIWKLTDTRHTGVADHREVWFDGKTIEGCANDIHGPYLGPDGWIYWCKGAFQEQTYERPKGPPFVTRAAHIFRRRPEGGFVEPVLTGGMNNPVGVAFSPGGERFLSSTFLENPQPGKRDGLIHAIYGGVYGKQTGLVENYPRTGPLMPVLTQMGPAAVCGLARLETNALGEGFADNLMACQFNLHKVSRHILVPSGATYTTKDQDFVTSTDVEFHPTDVKEDADGSLLVIDTGGWYKLCCPTSRLRQPDVLGGIYRISRIGQKRPDDPRGAKLPWDTLNARQLAELLGDPRFAVRRRAQYLLAKQGEPAIAAVSDVLRTSTNPAARIAAVWTLTRIPLPAARAAVRPALADADEQVRQAAAQSAAVWRDAGAEEGLRKFLSGASLPNRRVAAEGLGRIGDPAAVPDLLAAAADYHDQVLEHSLTYALMEIADPQATRVGLSSKSPHTLRVALIALDQMTGGTLTAKQVAPLLTSSNDVIRESAWWVAMRHGNWAGMVVEQIRGQVFDPHATPEMAAVWLNRLLTMTHTPAVHQLVADGLSSSTTTSASKDALLTLISTSGVKRLSKPWAVAFAALLDSPNAALRAKAVATLHGLNGLKFGAGLEARLRKVAADKAASNLLRLQALSTAQTAHIGVEGAKPKRLPLSDAVFSLVVENLTLDQPLTIRLISCDILAGAPLTEPQRLKVCEALAKAGPGEMRLLLPPLAASKNPQLGLRIVAMLEAHPALTSLDAEFVRHVISPFGPQLLAKAGKVFASIEQANRDKFKRIDALVELVKHGNPLHGQQVFFSARASCSTCHTVGFVGGHVGPALTDVGRIRTERDLLESILYPSDSFVRTFEPMVITTTSGKVYNGLIKDENERELVLVVDAQTTVRIPHDEIDSRQEGKVSVMPAGLDKQLAPQDLADIVAFLKAAEK